MVASSEETTCTAATAVFRAAACENGQAVEQGQERLMQPGFTEGCDDTAASITDHSCDNGKDNGSSSNENNSGKPSTDVNLDMDESCDFPLVKGLAVTGLPEGLDPTTMGTCPLATLCCLGMYEVVDLLMFVDATQDECVQKKRLASGDQRSPEEVKKEMLQGHLALDFKRPDTQGLWPFYAACAGNKTSVVRLFLKPETRKGGAKLAAFGPKMLPADVGQCGEEGLTPFYMAIEKENCEIVNLILNWASENCRSEEELAAVGLNAPCPVRHGETPFMRACAQGNAETIAAILNWCRLERKELRQFSLAEQTRLREQKPCRIGLDSEDGTLYVYPFDLLHVNDLGEGAVRTAMRAGIPNIAKVLLLPTVAYRHMLDFRNNKTSAPKPKKCSFW